MISEIGFGAWAIGGGWGPQDDAASRRTLHAALDSGVNFIDTAQGYGDGHSETLIGEVLAERSEETFVATKVSPVPDSTTWPPPDDADARRMFPADYIIEQCEGSLRRLKRDTIDLYQFHTWSAGFTLQDEWYEAVLRLKKQGKIRAFGASIPDTMPDCIIDALRFVLSYSGVTTAIPGMRTTQQVAWNTGAGDGKHLALEEVDAMRELAWEKDFWFEELQEERA